jgi:membrane-associated phospholipid phosphatase
MQERSMVVPRWWPPVGRLIFVSHFLLATAILGFKPEYLVIDAIGVGFLSFGPRCQRFAMLMFPIWLAGLAYDNLMPLMLDLRGPIHVSDLYFSELRWFGIGSGATRQTLCEYFAQHHWPAVDLICGFVYMAYIPEMLPFAVYLFFKDRRRLARLAWIFCLVHIANLITYLLYPAAPPWYVAEYGLGPAVLGVPSSAAGFGRVDQLLGIGVVHWFYAHNANVFGAMPSGHCGSAVLFALVAAGMGRKWFIPAATFAAIMCFGAVYFGHHYVWDVVAGAGYAVTGFAVVTVAEAYLARGGALGFPATSTRLREVRW